MSYRDTAADARRIDAAEDARAPLGGLAGRNEDDQAAERSEAALWGAEGAA